MSFITVITESTGSKLAVITHCLKCLGSFDSVKYWDIQPQFQTLVVWAHISKKSRNLKHLRIMCLHLLKGKGAWKKEQCSCGKNRSLVLAPSPPWQICASENWLGVRPRQQANWICEHASSYRAPIWLLLGYITARGDEGAGGQEEQSRLTVEMEG